MLLETALASGYSIDVWQMEETERKTSDKAQRVGEGLLREGGTQWDARIGG